MARHVSRYYKDPTEDINEHSGDDLNQIHSSIIDSDDNVIVDAANGTISGDVTGDVTGNLTGNVTGNVTGNITGNVLRPGGDVVIDASGDTVDAGTITFNTGLSDGTTTIDGFDTTITGTGSVDDVPTSSAVVTWVNTRIEDNNDLDISGDSGTGNIELDTQSLTIEGTTNEIETSASNQTVTVGLPNDVTISNDLTVTRNLTVSGNISGTLSTTVTEDIQDIVGGMFTGNTVDNLTTTYDDANGKINVDARQISVDSTEVTGDINFVAGTNGADFSVSSGTVTLNIDPSEFGDNSISTDKINGLGTYIDGRVSNLGQTITFANAAAFPGTPTDTTITTPIAWHPGEIAIIADTGATYIFTGTNGDTTVTLADDFHQITANSGAISGSTADSRYVRYDTTQTLTADNQSTFRTNAGLAAVSSSGSYNDLTNRPNNLTQYHRSPSVAGGSASLGAATNLTIVRISQDDYDNINATYHTNNPNILYLIQE